MNYRLEEIDNFLKEAAEYNKDYPEDFDYTTVYYALAKYNMSEEDIENHISFEQFEQWTINAGDNIEGKVCPNTSYFWLFSNPMLLDYEAKHKDKVPIKLYVPVDKSTFVNVFPKLFKFLSDNDIMHISKISADVRTDDVVLRLYNLYEAEQLIKFVNENFQNQLLETNPFVLREGLVGISADVYHSYNLDVSIHIVEFIKQTDIEDVSIDTFKSFIKNNIKDFSGEDKMIMNILLISLDKKTTIKDFFEYWDVVTDIPKGEEVDEVSYSNRSFDKYDSFEKNVESREYAKGLEARRKNDSIKKEERKQFISNLREVNGNLKNEVFLKQNKSKELEEIDDKEAR